MSRPHPLLCSLLLVLGACATSIAGRYDLQTIDGEPLPAVFMDTEIIAADIQLNDDGTCLINSTERGETGVAGAGTDENCSWTMDGATITVTDSNAPLTGSVTDDSLILTTQNGAVFGLTRR